MMSPPPESNVERMLGLKIMTLEQRLAAVEQFVESRFCETFRGFASRTAGGRLCEKSPLAEKQEEGGEQFRAAVVADEQNTASPNKAAEGACVEKPVARLRQAAGEKRVILSRKSSKHGFVLSPAARTKGRRGVPPSFREVVVLSSDSEKDGEEEEEEGIEKSGSNYVPAGVREGQDWPRLPQNGQGVQEDEVEEMRSAEEGAGSYRPPPARRKRKAKSKASSYSRWRKRFLRKKEPAAGPEEDKSLTVASSRLCDDPDPGEPWPAADDPNCQNSNQPKAEEMETSVEAMEGEMKTYELPQSPAPSPTPPQSNGDGSTEIASEMEGDVMSAQQVPPNNILKDEEEEDADSEYRCAEEELSTLSENCPAFPIEDAGDMSWETPMSLIQAICSAIVIEEGEESWGSGASPPKIYARLDDDDDKSSVTAMPSNSPAACIELDEDLAMIAEVEHVSQTTELVERDGEGGNAESGACTGDSDSVPPSLSADPFVERKCRIRIFYCPACQGGFKCKEELEEHRRSTHLDSDDEKKEDILEAAEVGHEFSERIYNSPERKKQRKVARKRHRRHLKRKRERRAAREEQLPDKAHCEHIPEQDSGVTSDSSSLSQGKGVEEHQEGMGRQADVSSCSSSERVKRPYRKRQRTLSADPVTNERQRRGRPRVTLPEDGLLICSFEDCGYIPDNEKEYRAHLRVHPLKHAVSCPVCERKFIEKLNLEEHLKSHRKCVPHDVTMISINKSRALQPSVILQRLPL